MTSKQPATAAIRQRHSYPDGRLQPWDTCSDEDHAADLHAILAIEA